MSTRFVVHRYRQDPLMDLNETLLEAGTYLYEFHQEHGMLKGYSERLNKEQSLKAFVTT